MVDVIVLNYNGSRHLAYCLPSLEQSMSVASTIYVADNASNDESRSMTEAVSKSAKWLRLERNFGWARGNNEAIKKIWENGADLYALANNDIYVHRAWLSETVRLLEVRPEIGIVGFDVFEGETSWQSNSAFLEAYERYRSPANLIRAKRVGGMAMVVRRTVIEAIGLFDEAFFAYGEEVDFQIRAEKHGIGIGKISVPIWHFGGGSFGAVRESAAAHQIRNNILLIAKHSGPVAAMKSSWRFLERLGLRGKRQILGYGVESRLRHGRRLWRCWVAALAVLWLVRRLDRLILVRLGRRNTLLGVEFAATRTRRAMGPAENGSE